MRYDIRESQKMSGLFKIVKESGINFTGSLVGMVLNYVFLMIITRLLAPSEFGTFVIAQSIISVAMIFVLLGTPKALDRFIPFYNARGDLGKTKTLIYGILKMALTLSVVLGLIMATISGFLAHSLFKNSQLSLVLKIMVVSMPLFVLIQLISFAFIGFKELRYRIYIQQLALPSLKLLLAALVFILGYGLWGWVWAYNISLLCASLFALWFFKRRISPILSKVRKIPISFREIVSYSWPLSIYHVILIFFGQTGVLFLGYFRSPAEVGSYRIYIYLVMLLGLVLSSFAQIYKPVISELISMGEVREIKEIYRRLSKWIFLINGLGFLIFLILGKQIIGILFTKSYLIAPVAFFILAAGVFLNSAWGPEGMTLEAFGNTKLSLLNSILMLITNVGLNYLLTPPFGIFGAAIALATSLTIGGLAGLIEIYWLYRLQPFNREYLKYVLVILVAGAVFYSITHRLSNMTPMGLIGLITLLTIIYFLGLYYSRSLDQEDYQVLTLIKAKLANVRGIK